MATTQGLYFYLEHFHVEKDHNIYTEHIGGKFMRRNALKLTVLCGLILVGGNCTVKKKYIIDINATVENVKYASVRSSAYGIEPFPEPEAW